MCIRDSSSTGWLTGLLIRRGGWAPLPSGGAAMALPLWRWPPSGPRWRTWSTMQPPRRPGAAGRLMTSTYFVQPWRHAASTASPP
eukprot:14685190-Alexandrium_andersonii.AAC.1